MGWRIYALIFVAGLITAVGTGIGTIPLFWADDVNDRLDVGLWGLAGGLMASASIFGLGYEMYRHPGDTWIGLVGVLGGVLLVVLAHNVIERLDFDYDAHDIAEGDLQTVVSVFLVLLVHSFPEGLAIGVAFAHLPTSNTLAFWGFTIPLLAVVMTVTIAIHNMPEGVAIGVPLTGEEGVGNARMFGAAVFSSLPQPIGAVVAYYFLQFAQQFLEFGYGFAAGAMLYLVVQDIIPEGLEAGESLERPKRVLAAGGILGFLGFAPLVFFL
ncbi:ZIP family metal transporter [Salarchaeum sp. JOR-1]|uniref:ZIP family metal transporter n=1 Tax=Salarchaeum sp. JOR-1 TaxID=2599399 RepID=UPI001198BE64|nr:ZIP family metal transporter [Salarchaeum sp. JOR-1]QDX40700.1 ZIP family metal transporter [Salarchaeum sp. JOR-1]